MNSDLKVSQIKKNSKTDKHHEYRERHLPAYLISYEDDEAIKAFVSNLDGKSQTIRHRS